MDGKPNKLNTKRFYSCDCHRIWNMCAFQGAIIINSSIPSEMRYWRQSDARTKKEKSEQKIVYWRNIYERKLQAEILSHCQRISAWLSLEIAVEIPLLLFIQSHLIIKQDGNWIASLFITQEVFSASSEIYFPFKWAFCVCFNSLKRTNKICKIP